ncbi:MAG TPA: NUDIX hydrolase [Mycobacteriales bacterium]|nr:NUDIX hydrolase [Mycobacteriales bacterium]
MAGEPPPELLERARALRAGHSAPAAPRDAATIALLRQTPRGPQTYLLRRVVGMVFGGMHVFPGGSVDPADAEAATAWAGPPPAAFAEAFGCDEPLARALVCAAVRETFEEAGVLLAGPSAGEVLADVSTEQWEAERVALESRRQSLSELLGRRGLVLRADLLRPLAHWVTPEVEPRRFDTRFFVAEVPAGQVARDVGGEADDRLWIRPVDALERGLTMLPPTAAALSELAGHDDVATALRAPRRIRRILPRLVVHEDDRVDFLLPGDEGYPEGP